MYKKDFSSFEGIEGWEKKTIATRLKEWANRYGDKEAIVDMNTTISYKQLYEKSLSIGSALVQKGFKPGDNVVLQLPNGIYFVEIFFGCIMAGLIPVLALPAHRKGDLEEIFRLSEPVAYFIPDEYMGYDYRSMADYFKANNSSLKEIIIEGETILDSDCDNISDVLNNVSPYSTAILLLSGGTTKTPKLIPRTHADYMYNSYMAAKKAAISSKSVYLTILPVAHNFSLSCPGILGVLNAGGTVVMAPSSAPDEVLPMIESYHVTITAMVPALIPLFDEVMSWDLGYDLSSLEILQVGGALLEPSVAKLVVDKWPCKLMQVFGTAEGLICFTNLDDDEDIIINYQGFPISDKDEIKIVDENFNELPEGEYGHLIAKGPYTIDGYYKLPEVNKTCFTEDGFYMTGDRACFNKNIGIKMGGRMKEQINRGGEKIMPAEIEGYLAMHEKISESAVLGIEDSELGQRTCAFLKLKDMNDNMDRQDVNLFFKKLGVAAYKMPDSVFVVQNWPFTSVGKIDKKQLKAKALEQLA